MTALAFAESGSSPTLDAIVGATLSNLDEVQTETELTVAKGNALAAWGTYRAKAEPLGLDFGRKMHKVRGLIARQGKKGVGFRTWLLEEGIPKTTAYYWIINYEISIGEREAKVDKALSPGELPEQSRLTLTGKSFFVVLQALQSEIRRGEEKAAVQRAFDLLGARAHITALWNRLAVIAGEDIGLANLDAAKRVREYQEEFERQRKTNNPNKPEKLFVVQAVAYLCRSPKSRIVDNLIGVVEGEAKIAARGLPPVPEIDVSDVATVPLEPTPIPDYINQRGHRANGAAHFYDVKARLENCTLDDEYHAHAREIAIALEQPVTPVATRVQPTVEPVEPPPPVPVQEPVKPNWVENGYNAPMSAERKAYLAAQRTIIDLKDGMRVRVDGRVYDVTYISAGVDEDENGDLMESDEGWDETKVIYHIGLYARRTKVALPVAPKQPAAEPPVAPGVKTKAKPAKPEKSGTAAGK